MKFWKFEAPPQAQIDSVIASGSLPPVVTIPGLNNTFDRIAARLSLGDGVLLGRLSGEEGKIIAFGKVMAVGATPAETVVRWTKKSHGVFPTGSGLEHWKTKTAFEISPEPATRYGLRDYIDFHLREVT